MSTDQPRSGPPIEVQDFLPRARLCGGSPVQAHGNVRRPLLAIATIVLLTYGYASSYCGAHWLLGRRLITPRVYELLNESVYYPMQSYISQDWPGSRTIRIMSIWCMFDGGGNRLTWDEAAGWAKPTQW